MADVGKSLSDEKSLPVNGLTDNKLDVNQTNDLENRWGFNLEELYKIALKFYKEKEGTKALHVSYKEKLKLVAYTKQVAHGKCRADVSSDVGFLDVVGNDRQRAWELLGDMDRTVAMTEFVQHLDTLCPLFTPYVQAHLAEKEEQKRKMEEEEERKRKEEEERERQRIEEEMKQSQEAAKLKQKQQELQIQASLNQQTAIQFKQYAEQQFPGSKEQQEILIKQLQEQHFQQYMQQVYQQQLLHQQQQYQQLQAMAAAQQQGGSPPQLQPHPQSQVQMHSETEDQDRAIVQNSVSADEEDDNDDEQNELPPIAAASMWTRKDLKEFKDSIRKDPEAIIKVGSGETITVRVPTHEDGTCLFWEFATDSYDIGFGVYFEWTIAPSNQVSVHVSESSDEEDLDEEGERKDDIEKGKQETPNAPTDEIIPVYRRDSHEEVYCGNHMYPGRGVYLLKFDNSYSLWRSKTLYYRVYYTR